MKNFLLVSLLISSVSTAQVPLTTLTPKGEAAYQCEAAYPLSLKNQKLQKELEAIIKRREWQKLVDKKKLAISVVDLSPMTRIHYVGVNDDHMLYSASLPKIVALFAYAQATKEKKVTWSKDAEKKLSKMINKSDNKAATWAVNQVGLEYIEELLKRPGYCFYGIKKGGLWLGKPFQKSTPANRDPLFNISHGATARQTARWYTMLYKNLLVGPIGNERISKSMRPPAIRHKFVAGLKGKEDLRIFARKSGSWRTFHSDSIIVEHKSGVRYAAVALTDDKQGGRILKTLIQDIDELISKGAHRTLPLVPIERFDP